MSEGQETPEHGQGQRQLLEKHLRHCDNYVNVNQKMGLQSLDMGY